MDGSGSGYLKTVCDYVHLNPARAKLQGRAQSLQSLAYGLRAETTMPLVCIAERLKMGSRGT